MTLPYRIEPLSENHDRGSFSCGERDLNKYIKRTIDRDSRIRLSKCFVAVDNKTEKVIGYYTLSAGSIPVTSVPEALAIECPYPDVPVILLGRFATHVKVQGTGFGTALLYYAITQAMNSPIAAVGVMLDALNDKAKEWYLRPGREFDVLEERKLILTFDKFLQIQDSLQPPNNAD
jgi:hypothetical protein